MYSSRYRCAPTGAAADVAARCEAAIRDAGQLRILARVWENDRAIDLAVQTLAGSSLVIRCVDDAKATDHTALQTMIAQGPFKRALLVCLNEGNPTRGGVPCCDAGSVGETLRHLVSDAGQWT